MKRNVFTIFSLLIVMSMLLGACATATETATEVPAEPTAAPVEPTEEPAPPEPPAEPEPTEEPEPEAADPADADLDGAFSAMLDSMVKYNTIKMDELSALMAEDEPPFLIDVRTTGELEEKGHIEGAVHIPLRELAQHIVVMPDFDTPIVVYCGSGWRATIAITALSAMGWTDVRALKNLYADWVEAGYATVEGLPEDALVLEVAEPDPAMVAAMDQMLTNIPDGYGVLKAEDLNTALAESSDLVVIDARTPGETEEKGVIDTGDLELKLIPLEEWIAMTDQWPADLATPTAVYCGSGHRSTIAMAMLWSYGYEDVGSLKGGYGGWASEGYPTVGGVTVEDKINVAYSDMLANMEKYNTIKMDELSALMAEDEPPFVLDVRTTAELEEKGHIEGAVHIPLRELAQNIDLLPAFDTPIVAYCGSGWRATVAMTALSAMGWTDVRALKNLYADWVEAGYATAEGLPPEAMVLEAANPDAQVLERMDAVLTNIPEGYGVLKAEDLNTALAENPDLILMDVRTQGELDEKGVIDAGENELIALPIEEFIAGQDMWPEDMGADISVYCGSGHRSTMAMTMLWSYLYESVNSLKGGFGGWVEAGYPVAEYAVP